MTITLQPTPQYYFLFDQVFIVVGQPGAQEAMQRCPDMPVVNQQTIDLIEELMRSKATAEGKLRLLAAIIQLMQSDEDTARKEPQSLTPNWH